LNIWLKNVWNIGKFLLNTSFNPFFSRGWENLPLCEALTCGVFDRVNCQYSQELYQTLKKIQLPGSLPGRERERGGGGG